MIHHPAAKTGQFPLLNYPHVRTLFIFIKGLGYLVVFLRAIPLFILQIYGKFMGLPTAYSCGFKPNSGVLATLWANKTKCTV